MKIKIRALIKFHLPIAMLLSAMGSLRAQDIHFTQFFTNPLSLNPAQTGYFDGNYRIGFNFKAQWPWAISNTIYNHHTETPYFDFSFGERKIKVGWMGIGFNFVNDEAGDGRLTYRRFGISYAYHQAFDREHKYILSAGVAASYVIRSVDFSKFYFNSQWVEDEGFNRELSSNESPSVQRFSYMDVGVGLNFGAQVHERVKLDFGGSMLHVNRPKHSFFGDPNSRLGFRYQAMAGAVYTVNNQVAIHVNGYYGYEKKASEGIAGAMLGYSPSRGSNDASHTVYFGAYYRVKDALGPLIGYRFKGLRFLFSYDVTLSRLLKPAKANGGPELSVVYTGKWGPEQYKGKKVYCPKF